MPYGIKNETPKQTAWMEKCVSSVMKQNPKYKESRAIAICKAQLKKMNWKVPSDSESELSMGEELWELEKKIREAINGPRVDEVQSSPWVADVFDDFAIVEKDNKLYKLNWSMQGDDVTVDWSSAIEVERVTTYEPVSESEESPKVPRMSRGKNRVITYGNITG